jgi:hypothetical protein
MPVKLCLSNRTTLTGVIVGVLLSASSAKADDFDDAVAAHKRQDYATAFALMRPLADQGVAKAQYDLGFMYAEGQGVAQDYAEAARWYRLAADQGHVAAQTNLGFMYNHGQGVAQNYAEAMKWYRLAADQGHVTAQYNLGVMYAEGRGVAQDYVQAYMWFYLAAAQGDAKALKNRDSIAAKMTSAQIAEAQRLEREWKPTK